MSITFSMSIFFVHFTNYNWEVHKKTYIFKKVNGDVEINRELYLNY